MINWFLFNFACGFVLIWLTLLGVVTLYDLSEWQIPNRLICLSFIIVVLNGFLLPEISLWSHISGILVGGGLLLLMAILKPGSIGGGDIKWMATCGWLLGGEKTFLALWLAMAIAAIYVLFEWIRKKDKLKKVPLGPCFCLGIGLVYFVRV